MCRISVCTTALHKSRGSCTLHLLDKGCMLLRCILTVATIHCENCIVSIIQSVSEIEGIESVEGDAENKLIAIMHERSAKIRDLVKQEITKEGHVVA